MTGVLEGFGLRASLSICYISYTVARMSLLKQFVSLTKYGLLRIFHGPLIVC